MKTRVIILAGGKGTRLGILTAKRAKPAVPFAAKYRIIDFPLSNCVNSGLFDLIIIAQYRPHSMIEHIGAGGPWDLNRDFTGGVRIYTPYNTASSADWFIGTADAVQQNFFLIKSGEPDLFLILSSDHVYTMDYQELIKFHISKKADVTVATYPVPIEEASRYGIVEIDSNQKITSFIEKPAKPPSNLVNMGIYLFNCSVLDEVLWADHLRQDSTHDFGKDILPAMVKRNASVYAYPYQGYWVDVGTVESYWQSHMDLLDTPPKLDIYNRSWVIHTRTEERPPAKVYAGASIDNCLISHGCIIEGDTQITRSILSPGVVVQSGSVIKESIILTDTVIKKDAVIQRSILDKKVVIGEGTTIGNILPGELNIAMVGKGSTVPPKTVIEAGAMIGNDVVPSDFNTLLVKSGEIIQTRRLPNEI